MNRTIVAFFMSRQEANRAVQELHQQDLIIEAHLMDTMDIAAEQSNRLWDSQVTIGEVADEAGGVNLVVRVSSARADRVGSALLDLGARRAEIY
ncbi:MAG: hypothetical protein ACYC5Y_15145 [Symbiobacteriia bacterium]